MSSTRQALIFGATGNIGGATARELLQRGWAVRAVTRDPGSEKALQLAQLGAQLVKADMDDRASLEEAFEGATYVFSVQNWATCGVAGEVRQGKLVADVAHEARVRHLVFGSAGMGEAASGVPHFDSKVIVESHMRDLGLPLTVVRSTPFMELMTDKAFFPALGAWGAMPRVLGWDTPLPWVAVKDIGATVANAFEAPDRWIGHDLTLCGDVRTLRECRTIFQSTIGSKPRGLPIPVPLFQKLAGAEFVTMWRWLADLINEQGAEGLWDLVGPSHEACPTIHSVETWLSGLAGENNRGKHGTQAQAARV